MHEVGRNAVLKLIPKPLIACNTIAEICNTSDLLQYFKDIAFCIAKKLQFAKNTLISNQLGNRMNELSSIQLINL